MRKQSLWVVLLLGVLLLVGAYRNETADDPSQNTQKLLLSFCTTNKDGRYDRLRADMEAAGMDMDAALKAADTYHREIFPYLTESCREKVQNYRMLLRLDESASIKKVSVTAREVELTEEEGKEGSYRFTVYAVVTSAEGITEDTEQSGSLTLRDGLVDTLSFDRDFRLFGLED